MRMQHDVGANQYTPNRGWASGRQGGGSNYVAEATAKYSRTYASAVGGAEPRFDDRTPSIGLLQERLRPRNAGRYSSFVVYPLSTTCTPDCSTAGVQSALPSSRHRHLGTQPVPIIKPP